MGECGHCESDARGPHAPGCPFRKRGDFDHLQALGPARRGVVVSYQLRNQIAEALDRVAAETFRYKGREIQMGDLADKLRECKP